MPEYELECLDPTAPRTSWALGSASSVPLWTKSGQAGPYRYLTPSSPLARLPVDVSPDCVRSVWEVAGNAVVQKYRDDEKAEGTRDWRGMPARGGNRTQCRISGDAIGQNVSPGRRAARVAVTTFRPPIPANWASRFARF